MDYLVCLLFENFVSKRELQQTVIFTGHLPPDKARDEFFTVKQGGKSMSFDSTSEWVQRLGIRNWVTVVVGWVTKIDRYCLLLLYQS
jgi:hypothetical protein